MATYATNGYQDYNGGGFTHTNNYNAGSAGDFQDSSSQNKAQQRNTLTPVTIKQINESTQLVPDGEFIINNVELAFVSFIGVIRNVVDNTSSLTLTVEDGTGSIDVRKWLDDSANESPASQLPVGIYVYVTGALKEFNGKKNLQHATVRPIIDHNEVLYHHLSAIVTHLHAQGLSTNNNGQNSNPLFVPNTDGNESKSNVERIYEFIHDQTPSMPEGVPIQLIAQTLNLMVEDVQLHCAKLTEDGKVYHGYDDNGFLAV
ncbi:hypothetical protein PACTADRAFT_75465 [Pachysolen tannophilus NRRL Y-2460]|uniref:Replication protein A C-terminal domain-containing protein n=1 Tax=Pachysolen tannophilus NRRL Y-2460 TaxID=669874 RepID=A0A1E4TX48_PACTA|nr:hypothetical protein PACTADRAFT_75465 [Pachysolen tannophilus NRRL Y-2460]